MTRFDDDRKRSEDLVQGILARTSGPACGRALELLPRLADADLDPVDRSLVQGHLEHCPGCRQVAVILGWLDGELPAMAEVDPGEEFTAAVLARTARLPSRAAAAGHLTGGALLMDRIGRWWRERIERPLFAWQAAYALTVLLVVLTAVPGAPLRGAPGAVLATFQSAPGGVPVLGSALTAVDAGADAAADWVRDSLWDPAWRDLDGRLVRTTPARRALGADLEDAWRETRAGRPGHALVELSAAARDVHRVWTLWWLDDSDDSRPTTERRPS